MGECPHRNSFEDAAPLSLPAIKQDLSAAETLNFAVESRRGEYI